MIQNQHSNHRFVQQCFILIDGDNWGRVSGLSVGDWPAPAALLQIENALDRIWQISSCVLRLTPAVALSSGVLWELRPLLVRAEPPAASHRSSLHPHPSPRVAHTHRPAPGAAALHEQMHLKPPPLLLPPPRGLAPHTLKPNDHQCTARNHIRYCHKTTKRPYSDRALVGLTDCHYNICLMCSMGFHSVPTPLSFRRGKKNSGTLGFNLASSQLIVPFAIKWHTLKGIIRHWEADREPALLWRS